MHISIELHDGDSYCARELYPGETLDDFIKAAQDLGGVWMSKGNGVQPFIPYSQVKMIWFDDETSEQEVYDLQSSNPLSVN